MIVLTQKANTNRLALRMLINPRYLVKVIPSANPEQPNQTGSYIYMREVGIMEVTEHVSDIEKMIEEHERSRQLIPIQIPH
jgi:hypothetical protein